VDESGANLIEVPCPLCDACDTADERVVDGHRLGRCRRCGFVFANPQLPADDLEKIYDNVHTDHLIALYSRIASPSVLERYRDKLDLLEGYLPGKGRLLDFGCAAGYFLELAASRGWDSHGSDVGAWAATAAARRGVKNLRVGHLRELEFPAGYFDVVYAAQIFEHLPRPLDDLREIRRILRPGGLLYIDVPNYQTIPILTGRDDFMLNAPPQHLNYFTPTTLATLFSSGGFSSILIGSGGGLKWENLLGRGISSDIKNAYQLDAPTPGSHASPLPDRRVRGTSTTHALKTVARKYLVRPLLYDRLRLGMLLYGLARRGDD
jgi:SAM-dependent methyltransferase